MTLGDALVVALIGWAAIMTIYAITDPTRCRRCGRQLIERSYVEGYDRAGRAVEGRYRACPGYSGDGPEPFVMGRYQPCQPLRADG